VVLNAAEAVFHSAEMLPVKTSDTYIKERDLRGLVNIKQVNGLVEFALNVIDYDTSGTDRSYTMIMSMIVNYSAIDFRLNDIREFTIEESLKSDNLINSRNVNKELKKISDEILEKQADALARELIKIYGARL